MVANLSPYANPSISTTMTKMPSKDNSMIIDYSNMTLFALSINDQSSDSSPSIIDTASILNNVTEANITVFTGISNLTNSNSMMNDT